MSNYDEKTVAELKDEAKSRDLSGYSDKNKEDLVKFLDDDDNSASSDSEAEPKTDAQERAQDVAGESQEAKNTGFASEASDADNPDVKEGLSPEGQEALGEMDEAQSDVADLALDASGPLHLQKPSERIMAGAVSEEEAKAQEELIGELPEDHVGNILGDGTVPSSEAPKGSGPNDELVQEDVVDFPPPLAEVEEDRKDSADGKKATGVNAPYVKEEAALAAFPNEGETVAQYRAFNQRGQLYTDGLSGVADHNTALAYRLPDITPSAQESDNPDSDSKDSSDDEEK